MAVAAGSVTSSSSASGTAISVSEPAGTAVGDLISITITVNAPAGAAPGIITSDNNGSTPFTKDLADAYCDNTGMNLSVWSRIKQTGDPATFNFTIPSAQRWGITATQITGVDTTTIYDVAPDIATLTVITGSGILTTTSISTAITTTTNDAMVGWSMTADTANDFYSGAPGSTVLTAHNDTNQACAFYTQQVPTATTIASQTFTHALNDGSIVAVFAFKAASGVGPAGNLAWITA